MFKEWGFLLAEIWVLLVAAGLLGLFAGWLIWGGRRHDRALTPFEGMQQALRAPPVSEPPATTPKADVADPVQPAPGALPRRGYQRPNVAPLTDQAAQRARPLQTNSQPEREPTMQPEPRSEAKSAPNPASPATVPKPQAPEEVIFRSAAAPGPTRQNRPPGLPTARHGLPDDLTKIKGVGEKLEKLCNSLGFWHYDQIATWTPEEARWVDDNLEGFKGRVTRDQWVAQAQVLAGIETPVFIRRPD